MGRKVDPRTNRCELAKQLLLCREALRASQTDFAKIFGIQQPAYSTWEKESNEERLTGLLLRPPGIRTFQPKSAEDHEESYWMMLFRHTPQRRPNETLHQFSEREANFRVQLESIRGWLLPRPGEPEISDAAIVHEGATGLDTSMHTSYEAQSGATLRHAYPVIHPDHWRLMIERNIRTAEANSKLGVFTLPGVLNEPPIRFLTVVPNDHLAGAEGLKAGELVMVTLQEEIDLIDGGIYLYASEQAVALGVARFGVLNEREGHDHATWYMTTTKWNAHPKRIHKHRRGIRVLGIVQPLRQFILDALNRSSTDHEVGKGESGSRAIDWVI